MVAMARLEVSVRPATDADVRPLAAVMGRALEDDSPFVWMLYQHFGFEPSGPMPLPPASP